MLGAGTAFGERVISIRKLLGIGSKQTLAGEFELVSFEFGSKLLLSYSSEYVNSAKRVMVWQPPKGGLQSDLNESLATFKSK
jgi:hypothetical protein